MQLDKTHVKVRARSISEIGDLSLILLRRYPGAWLIGLTLGAAPWILLNTLLLGWMPINDARDGIIDELTYAQRSRYTWLMISLVFLQTPIAGALMTFYIGQAVFEHRPPWRDVLRSVGGVFWQTFWVLGVLRGPLIAMMLIATVWGRDFAPGREGFWIGMIVVLALGLRAFRPFLPEILLLERCPLRRKEGDPATLTAGRRSRLLHTPIAADLFARSLLTGLLSLFLAGAIFYSLMFVRAIMTGQWGWSLRFGSVDIPDVQLVILPLSLWLVAGLSIVVRFLCYLDARIRLEGWEVELAVRAEAIRQFGSDLPENIHPSSSNGVSTHRRPKTRAEELAR